MFGANGTLGLTGGDDQPLSQNRHPPNPIWWLVGEIL